MPSAGPGPRPGTGLYEREDRGPDRQTVGYAACSSGAQFGAGSRVREHSADPAGQYTEIGSIRDADGASGMLPFLCSASLWASNRAPKVTYARIGALRICVDCSSRTSKPSRTQKRCPRRTAARQCPSANVRFGCSQARESVPVECSRSPSRLPAGWHAHPTLARLPARAPPRAPTVSTAVYHALPHALQGAYKASIAWKRSRRAQCAARREESATCIPSWDVDGAPMDPQAFLEKEWQAAQ